MSLESGCDRDPITITRLSSPVSQGPAGGQDREYTAAARGLLPTSGRCRLQEEEDDESIRFGVKGECRKWNLMFTWNPSLTVADAVSFTDSDGITHTEVRVIKASRNVDGQGRLYVAHAEELTNRK